MCSLHCREDVPCLVARFSRSSFLPRCCLAPHPRFAENRLALVIGQSAYKTVPVLPNPGNDAKAMAQMLTDSGFEVSSATDLSQNQMREKVSEFAGKIAAKGADTVAMIFYAGHGLQIDGENFLVPVDVDVKRESDIPMQAVRVNDILNTLTSVPSKMRFLLLDACRNNPFPELNKSVGRRAWPSSTQKSARPTPSCRSRPRPVRKPRTAPAPTAPTPRRCWQRRKSPTFRSRKPSSASGSRSTRRPTGGRRRGTASSLTEDFRFSGTPVAGPKLASAKKTVEEWKRDLKGKPVEEANELIVGDGTDEAYEAFATLYASTPRGLQANDWLDRHRRMTAWKNAVIINTAAGYRAFIAQYPDSDLVLTARKLEERLRYRPNLVAANAALPVQNASLAPTCSCNTPPASAPQPEPKKINAPGKKVDPDPPKRTERKPPKRVYEADDDDVVVRRPPPAVLRTGARPSASASGSASASVAAAMVAEVTAAAATRWRHGRRGY